MIPTYHTRKPIDDITITDLQTFPVWEFAIDEESEDETWVRPVNTITLPIDAYSLCVDAQYTTASGQSLPGFLVVSTNDNITFDGGAILHNGEYLFVPAATYHDAHYDYQQLAKALNLSLTELLPLQFTLAVPLKEENNPRSGEFNI